MIFFMEEMGKIRPKEQKIIDLLININYEDQFTNDAKGIYLNIRNRNTQVLKKSKEVKNPHISSPQGWIPKSFVVQTGTVTEKKAWDYLDGRLARDLKLLDSEQLRYKDERGRPLPKSEYFDISCYRIKHDLPTFIRLFLQYNSINRVGDFVSSQYWRHCSDKNSLLWDFGRIINRGLPVTMKTDTPFDGTDETSIIIRLRPEMFLAYLDDPKKWEAQIEGLYVEMAEVIADGRGYKKGKGAVIHPDELKAWMLYPVYFSNVTDPLAEEWWRNSLRYLVKLSSITNGVS